MRAVWLQAVEHESLGGVEPWLTARGWAIDQVSLWQHQALPVLDSFDFLVMTGGGSFPTDDEHYPWLAEGLALIYNSVRSGRHFLGICLGAQLLGAAFGGDISRNEQEEFGWYSVRLSREGMAHTSMRGVPTEFPAFHWHQDVVSVPLGATLLAASEGCPNQAFAVGRHALGVQFHPEITERKAKTFLRCAAPPSGCRYVQDPRTLLADPSFFSAQKVVLDRLLHNLLEKHD